MKSFGLWFSWALTNIAFGVLVWFGYFEHIGWCRNVVVFYVAITFVLSLFMLSVDVAKATARKISPLRARIDFVYDMIIVFVLAAVGSWILASLYATHAVLSCGAVLNAHEAKA